MSEVQLIYLNGVIGKLQSTYIDTAIAGSEKA
jgi:hypothetical protein